MMNSKEYTSYGKPLKYDENGSIITSDKKRENKRKNVDYVIKEGKLHIVVDLKKLDKLGENDISSSGKTYLLATTGGNIPLSGEYSHIKLGLNTFVSKEYLEGRKAVAKNMEGFKNDIQEIKKKDDKIASLEAELMELKAMMKQVLSK